MVRNALYWVRWIRRNSIPELDTLGQVVKERILPTFSQLEEEANRFAEEEYQRLGASTTFAEDTDPGDVAESANEAGITYYQTMDGARQGILNLFAAAVYHLFEQQLLLFHRQELLGPAEENDSKLWDISEAKKRLRSHNIELGQFTSWARIRVANVVKHADGDSARKLKMTRPDLFVHPELRDGVSRAIPPRWPVHHPIIGEGFYIDLDDFDSYLEAAVSFWKQMADVLEQQAQE